MWGAVAVALTSVCPSVRPSVALVNHTETVEDVVFHMLESCTKSLYFVMQFNLPGSTPAIFDQQR